MPNQPTPSRLRISIVTVLLLILGCFDSDQFTAGAQSDAGLARIDLSSNPPSNIVVDGQPVGRTPFQPGMAPGDHEVRLTAQTYADWTIRVKAVGGELITIPS